MQDKRDSLTNQLTKVVEQLQAEGVGRKEIEKAIAAMIRSALANQNKEPAIKRIADVINLEEYRKRSPYHILLQAMIDAGIPFATGRHIGPYTVDILAYETIAIFVGDRPDQPDVRGLYFEKMGYLYMPIPPAAINADPPTCAEHIKEQAPKRKGKPKRERT